MLADLENLRSDLEMIRADVAVIRLEIAQLKVKAGVWGLLGGAIPVIVALLMQFIKG